jgi:phospholipid/cholesterol/gamma-HCH transport system substrate-binding protein
LFEVPWYGLCCSWKRAHSWPVPPQPFGARIAELAQLGELNTRDVEAGQDLTDVVADYLIERDVDAAPTSLRTPTWSIPCLRASHCAIVPLCTPRNSNTTTSAEGVMTIPGTDSRGQPPYKTAGAVFLLLSAVVAALVFYQFRGDFTPKMTLTMIASRAGLVMDPGSKVTYNGVQIGRVGTVQEITVGEVSKAKLTLEVDPKYVNLIPANVDADIRATTVFGNKYVSFSSPKNATTQRIASKDVIDASAVTTEINTLFETITSIAGKVDPVKLNQTLTATAQALQGLGDRFGQSIVNGNDILADVNPKMPQIRYDVRGLADLADIYANTSPDLWNFLRNAVTTARTLNEQQDDIDAALMASIGFSNTGADIFERGGPYFVHGAADLIPTSDLLDEYSPEIFCTIRNYHDLVPKLAAAFGANGYSAITHTEIVGAGNPYVYPDNLPRVNAKGGPEGRPGCWQPVTHDLWPMPYLVMDTGASIAPYNHFGLGQPIMTEYVWGRQIGENTINP